MLRGKEANRAEAELQRGIKSYEEAQYEIAVRQLRFALELGLGSRRDKVNAYKYLAFVSCTSGKERLCYAEFRKALETDPSISVPPRPDIRSGVRYFETSRKKWWQKRKRASGALCACNATFKDGCEEAIVCSRRAYKKSHRFTYGYHCASAV